MPRRWVAAARRMAVLMMFGLTLLGAWIYWHAPTLNELRPQIQRYLQHQYGLSELSMGDLSWYWAGYLWLRADDLSLATGDGRLRLAHGHLAIRVSIWDLAFGTWRPSRIDLSNGDLTLSLPDTGGGGLATLAPVLFAQDLAIQDTNLDWRFGDMHGQLPHFSLNIDASARGIALTWPGMQLKARLDADLLPKKLTMAVTDLSWLPPALRRPLRGKPAATFSLDEVDDHRWQASIKAHAAQGAAIVLKPDAMELDFQQLEMHAVVVADRQGSTLNIREIHIAPLQWTLGDNSVRLTAAWNAGLLEATATAGRLDMPVLWGWLRPLGGPGWHHWLARMRHGVASHVVAKLALPWSDPGTGLPTPVEWQHLEYRVNADVAGADIALGNSGDALTDTDAQVAVDATGLKADISSAQLPQGIGSVQGKLLIPWSSLTLNIQGQAQVQDMAALIRWKRPDSPAIAWFTKPSTAAGSFALLWNPDEDSPSSAHATLHPDGAWPMQIGGLDLAASGGTIHWDLTQGLRIDHMHVATNILQGDLSMAMAEAADKRWALRSLDGAMTGGMADLVRRFQLPIAAPKGSFAVRLHYLHGWQGSADLGQAGWGNVLGTAKTIGEPLTVKLAAKGDERPGLDNIRITKLSGDSRQIRFSGTGLLTQDSLHLSLATLKSPAFDGGVQITAPFGAAPWKIAVHAKYMSRAALPKQLKHEASTLQAKSWALRARIDRFDWQAATIRGARLTLASADNSIGVFDADRVDTGGMRIRHVHAVFALPGAGAIDLRQCAGQVGREHIELSARMTPDDGGMRWQGFAYVTGDFGYLLKQAGISKRFLNGDMHMLFSGTGLFSKKHPWWQGLDGRLRLRVADGRILEGGTLNKLLAAMNLADLPKLLLGLRGDLTGPGMMYSRLQMEATMHNQEVQVHKIAMRSPAMDLAGNGRLTLDNDQVDVILTARPFQNLDAILSHIPLLRDILGGGGHTLLRQVYWMHGPFTDATVQRITPEEAGLAPPGLIESLLSLPERWFGKTPSAKPAH